MFTFIFLVLLLSCVLYLSLWLGYWEQLQSHAMTLINWLIDWLIDWLRHCKRNKRSNGWSELGWDYWHFRTGALLTDPIFISVILENCWKRLYLLSFCKCMDELKRRKIRISFALHALHQLLTDFRFKNLLVLCVFWICGRFFLSLSSFIKSCFPC